MNTQTVNSGPLLLLETKVRGNSVPLTTTKTRPKRSSAPLPRGLLSSVFLPSVILSSTLLAVASARADQPSDLVTDRPDQTESSVVVGKGFTQLETGWTFTRDDEDGRHLDVHEVPGTLLRVGLSERVELRIGWSGFVDAEASFGRSEVNIDGLGDGELGAKIFLGEERGRRPEMAILVGTSVPIGDDEFTSDRFDPNVRLAFAHTLSDRVSLGYNVGMSLESGPGADGATSTLSTAFYTVALGLGLTDKLGAFVELFGDIPMSASGGPANSFDGGFTYLVKDNVQLDLAGGLGLSDAAADWFVGLGVSVRFPH